MTSEKEPDGNGGGAVPVGVLLAIALLAPAGLAAVINSITGSAELAWISYVAGFGFLLAKGDEIFRSGNQARERHDGFDSGEDTARKMQEYADRANREANEAALRQFVHRRGIEAATWEEAEAEMLRRAEKDAEAERPVHDIADSVRRRSVGLDSHLVIGGKLIVDASSARSLDPTGFKEWATALGVSDTDLLRFTPEQFELWFDHFYMRAHEHVKHGERVHDIVRLPCRCTVRDGQLMLNMLPGCIGIGEHRQVANEAIEAAIRDLDD
jgi:hypothetical protein